MLLHAFAVICMYLWTYLLMQITKERPQAHVILATSDYSFLTWLKKSEPSSYPQTAMFMQQLTLLSLAEVKAGFFITEVIGDFPEPQACKYFQGLMSNKREVTDKEWTSVFEVRHMLLSPVI